VHPLTIVNAIKANLPDPIDTPGYRVYWRGISHRILQQSVNDSEVHVLLKQSHIRIKIPTSIFTLLEQQLEASSLLSEGISLSNFYASLETATELNTEQIIRSAWWQELRKALWILKLN
jgi:hypothetical protein